MYIYLSHLPPLIPKCQDLFRGTEEQKEEGERTEGLIIALILSWSCFCLQEERDKVQLTQKDHLSSKNNKNFPLSSGSWKMTFSLIRYNCYTHNHICVISRMTVGKAHYWIKTTIKGLVAFKVELSHICKLKSDFGC